MCGKVAQCKTSCKKSQHTAPNSELLLLWIYKFSYLPQLLCAYFWVPHVRSFLFWSYKFFKANVLYKYTAIFTSRIPVCVTDTCQGQGTAGRQWVKLTPKCWQYGVCSGYLLLNHKSNPGLYEIFGFTLHVWKASCVWKGWVHCNLCCAHTLGVMPPRGICVSARNAQSRMLGLPGNLAWSIFCVVLQQWGSPMLAHYFREAFPEGKPAPFESGLVTRRW